MGDLKERPAVDGAGVGAAVDGDGAGGAAVDGDRGRIRNDDGAMLREMQLTVAVSSMLPGFRFSPTDEELISYYLRKKIDGRDNCVDIIREVDLCRHEPWDLPAISVVRSDNEWFFFSSRGKKYPNGQQSRRATESGYWKATGKERNVKSGSATIGTKRTLVFHVGRAPRGERTEWIMHEYCMNEQDSMVVCRLRRNCDFRLTESSTRGYSDHNNLSRSDHNNLSRDKGNGSGVDNGNGSGTNENRSGVDNSNSGTNGNGTGVDNSNSDTNRNRSGTNGNGSESEPKLTNNSVHGCSSRSSQHKDYENEDDCFADILNDDIIKLDGSPSLKPFTTLSTTHCSPPPHPQETRSAQVLGLHVTAARRIKLRHLQKDHDNPSSSGCTNRATAFNDGTTVVSRRFVCMTVVVVVVLLGSLMLFVA